MTNFDQKREQFQQLYDQLIKQPELPLAKELDLQFASWVIDENDKADVWIDHGVGMEAVKAKAFANDLTIAQVEAWLILKTKRKSL